MRNRERLYIRELCKESRHICMQGRSWAGPHVGEIERESGAQGDKVCLFALGVVCEVSVREPHN